MRILILGAGGIIGSYMVIGRRSVGAYSVVRSYFVRRSPSLTYWGVDLSDSSATSMMLVALKPDAIVNLAGENRPDVVERNPTAYREINVDAAAFLAHWCAAHKAHYVHVSTQAVFGGCPSNCPPHVKASFDAPYRPDSMRVPVNQYGMQKLLAESEVMTGGGDYWTIVRPTFVLGVRPFDIGRQNPVEQMLANVPTICAEGEAPAIQRQVCDRFFSVSFAWDVAAKLWEIAQGEPLCRPVHVGIPYRTSRYVLASYLRPDITIEPVSHDSFDGLAPRPIDTTYAGTGTWAEVTEGLDRCKEEYATREAIAAAAHP